MEITDIEEFFDFYKKTKKFKPVTQPNYRVVMTGIRILREKKKYLMTLEIKDLIMEQRVLPLQKENRIYWM